MKQLTRFVLKEITDFCGCIGLMMKESKSESEYEKSVPLPISLFPCNIPLPFYQNAINIQPSINILIEKLSRDHKMIHEVLLPYTKKDDFLRSLLEVSIKFHSSKHKQDCYLGIIRSDYMIDAVKQKLQMVEYNTIASSFGVLSDKLNILQRFLYKRYPDLFPAEFKIDQLAPGNDFINNATKAFNDCIEIYRKQRKVSEKTEIYMAVIVQEGERNVYDQKPLEIEAMQKYNIPSIRLTLSEVFQNGKIDEETGVLKLYILLIIN